MIGDGYDFNGVVSGGGESIKISYRPMLRHERRRVREVASHVGGETGKSLILMFAANHINCWDRSRFASIVEMGDLEKSNQELWTRLWMVIAGVEGASPEWSPVWEDESAENLRRGIAILKNAPLLAKKTCDVCRTYWLTESGEYTYEGSERLLRPAGSNVPCECPSGCIVGHYKKQNRLSPENCRAFDHYMECHAVGEFPPDPIVKRNAAIIEGELRKRSGTARATR